MAMNFKRGITHVLALMSIICCFVMKTEAFDSFWFVQQWPPNVCSNLTRPCASPGLRAFYIHGMWPQQSGRSVTYCGGSAFSASNVATIRSQLDTAWPDVINGNNVRFWGHEWTAHGTCSESTYDQLTYFTLAYNLWANPNYNFLNILRPKGLGPNGRAKSLSQLRNTLAAGLGKIPGLRCNTNASTKQQQLAEIVMCTDADGKTLRDCNRDRCTGATAVW